MPAGLGNVVAPVTPVVVEALVVVFVEVFRVLLVVTDFWFGGFELAGFLRGTFRDAHKTLVL